MNTTEKPGLPLLAVSPDDVPRLTNGAISRTRVYMDIAAGRLHARKAGRRTIIATDELRRYLADLPSFSPTKPAA